MAITTVVVTASSHAPTRSYRARSAWPAAISIPTRTAPSSAMRRTNRPRAMPARPAGAEIGGRAPGTVRLTSTSLPPCRSNHAAAASTPSASPVRRTSRRRARRRSRSRAIRPPATCQRMSSVAMPAIPSSKTAASDSVPSAAGDPANGVTSREGRGGQTPASTIRAKTPTGARRRSGSGSGRTSSDPPGHRDRASAATFEPPPHRRRLAATRIDGTVRVRCGGEARPSAGTVLVGDPGGAPPGVTVSFGIRRASGERPAPRPARARRRTTSSPSHLGTYEFARSALCACAPVPRVLPPVCEGDLRILLAEDDARMTPNRGACARGGRSGRRRVRPADSVLRRRGRRRDAYG